MWLVTPTASTLASPGMLSFIAQRVHSKILCVLIIVNLATFICPSRGVASKVRRAPNGIVSVRMPGTRADHGLDLVDEAGRHLDETHAWTAMR